MTQNASLEGIFADVFCAEIAKRFRILQRGIDQVRPTDDKLPFMLSVEFRDRFESVLRQFLVPAMAARCKGILHRAGEQPEDRRRRFLKGYFDDRRGRVVMWETWRDTWKDLTEKKERPPKPNPGKLGISTFLKKEPKRPIGAGRELTPEEWEAAVSKVRESNTRARMIWGEIREDTGAYLPPEDGDKSLLMNLFARSVAGLGDQVKALRQIVEQGENIHRAFDRYQRNKDVELALLAACYQLPELFLGENSALEDLLKTATRNHYPLIARYLPEYIKPA